MGSDYYSSPYLSPFYSPCLGDCVEGSSDFGQPFAWWPLSAALIILIFPLGFRMTCYYYRKAYYRAFWLSPAGVRGRRAARQVHRRDPVPADPPERPPLLLVRRGRWSALILTYDVVLAFRQRPSGESGIHMGLGTLLMLVNVVLIWLYTLSLPLVPPHRRRPAAALLQAPGPLPALDLGLEAQRRARARTPGSRCSRWRWSTSTSTCSPPARSTT